MRRHPGGRLLQDGLPLNTRWAAFGFPAKKPDNIYCIYSNIVLPPSSDHVWERRSSKKKKNKRPLFMESRHGRNSAAGSGEGQKIFFSCYFRMGIRAWRPFTFLRCIQESGRKREVMVLQRGERKDLEGESRNGEGDSLFGNTGRWDLESCRNHRVLVNWHGKLLIIPSYQSTYCFWKLGRRIIFGECLFESGCSFVGR